MKHLRGYIPLLLVACLVLTGHSAAANRAARDANGQVILCTGAGPVTVFLDENGEPTGPPHICPDCMTHVLDLAVTPDQGNPQFVVYALRYRAVGTVAQRIARVPLVRARAPPLLG